MFCRVLLCFRLWFQFTCMSTSWLCWWDRPLALVVWLLGLPKSIWPVPMKSCALQSKLPIRIALLTDSSFLAPSPTLPGVRQKLCSKISLTTRLCHKCFWPSAAGTLRSKPAIFYFYVNILEIWKKIPYCCYFGGLWSFIICVVPFCNLIFQIWFSTEKFFEAWDHLVTAAESLSHSSLFRYIFTLLIRVCRVRQIKVAP